MFDHRNHTPTSSLTKEKNTIYSGITGLLNRPFYNVTLKKYIHIINILFKFRNHSHLSCIGTPLCPFSNFLFFSQSKMEAYLHRVINCKQQEICAAFTTCLYTNTRRNVKKMFKKTLSPCKTGI